MKAQPMLCLAGAFLAALLVRSGALADPLPVFAATGPMALPPAVKLQEIVTVGPDLALTFDWPISGEPLPPGARLRLSDREGLEVGSVGVAPVYGPQTVWIPNGALPRPADPATWPLPRYFELIAAPSNKILLEGGLDVSEAGEGRSVASHVRRPQATGMGSECRLILYDIRLFDPEDHNGDDPSGELREGENLWEMDWQEDVFPEADLYIRWSFPLCNSCQGIHKTYSFTLWDRDNPGFPLFDPDDELGTVSFGGCSAIAPTTAKISGSNYTYELGYEIACEIVRCP